MRNRFFLWIASALLLIAGCTNDEIVNEQQAPGEGKITLTASVPGETAQTRLSLIPDTESKNIIVTWQNGDIIKFYFKQGDHFSLTSTSVELTWDDISPDEKSATFTVNVPSDINRESAFTVYAVHGADSRLEGANVLVNVSPGAFTPFYQLQDVPIAGSVEVTPGNPINISFNHLGTLQCLAVENTAYTMFKFIPSLIFADPETGTDWFYTATEGNIPYYSLTEGTVTYFNEPLQPLAPQQIYLWMNDIEKLAQWIMPKADVFAPEIKLGALVPDGPIVSVNSKLQRESYMQTGKAYHLYAAWDGSSLYFTDDTFIPPYQSVTGSLMHADGGDDFIGIVYSKDNSRVYYSSSRSGKDWPNETDLGAGTEARMAIDRSNNPHVVFTTTDGKIAYRKLEGTTWSVPVYIETNNAGTCSRPDIDVDNSGYAHITYTDTKGNTGDYNDQPDIMYAENKTNGDGTFKKVVIYNGYVNNMGGSEWDRYFYDKGSRIAVDASGNYYIIAHQHRHNTSSGYQDHYYNLVIKTSTASGGTGTTSSDGHDIYDLVFVGENARALYKDNNVNRMAQIQVDGSTASFSDYPYDFTTSGIVPHGLSQCGYEVAGLSGSNLFVRFLDQSNPRETVFEDITVKANTRVAAVDKGDAFSTVFVVYTDADSSIKVREVHYEAPR